MSYTASAIVILILSCLPTTAREVVNFDHDWRFYKGGIKNGHNPDLNDNAWRPLTLPHDWSIEGRFHAKSPAGWRGGYAELGAGWYRKRFTPDATRKTRKMYLAFDGIYKNSDVWINGTHLGNRWYGYVPFRYDLTPHILWGEENVIAVRVRNEKQTCRWYSGSGIYRHVQLISTDRLAISYRGIYITTPKVSTSTATVRVQVDIENQYDTPKTCTVRTEIVDTTGKVIERSDNEATVPPNGEHRSTSTFTINSPDLWSASHPTLYKARTRILNKEKTVDQITTPFGIRNIQWNAKQGLLVNGQQEKLKGVNLHHDLGSIGAAYSARAMERRLAILKDMGCNAIRTSHNPPAAHMLDLCDRMGFYVIDEAFDKWLIDKRHATFQKDWPIDLLAMILRDRNHPSVILWSVGNENWAPEFAQRKAIYQKLTELARKHDNTRPFTYALSPGDFIEDARLMDIVSLNYQGDRFEYYRKNQPEMVILGSEVGSLVSSQRYGRNPWLHHRDHPFVAGAFLFTGIDYLGEARVKWPARSSYCGPIDTTGFRLPYSYLFQAMWSDQPMTHIAISADEPHPTMERPSGRGFVSHWTLTGLDAKPVNVHLFTNCEEVELLVNTKSLGRKKLVDFPDHIMTWNAVTYQPGEITAIGYRNNKQVSSHALKTAGAAARIQLTPDQTRIRADGQDLSHVAVTIVDANGNRIPHATDLVRFQVEGPGSLRAVDNGNPKCNDPFTGSSRSAYYGRCLAIIQSARTPGKITLTATTKGLPPATTVIHTGK